MVRLNPAGHGYVAVILAEPGETSLVYNGPAVTELPDAFEWTGSARQATLVAVFADNPIEPQSLLRTGEWALHLPGTGGPARLYLKPDDRWEVNDVAGRQPEVVERLEATLHGFAAAVTGFTRLRHRHHRVQGKDGDDAERPQPAATMRGGRCALFQFIDHIFHLFIF